MTLEEVQNLKEKLLSKKGITLHSILKVCILDRIESYLEDCVEGSRVKFDVDDNCKDPLEFLTIQLEDKLNDELEELDDSCIEYEEPVMYKAVIDHYEIGKNNKNMKPIILNDKEIYLSVGGYLSWGENSLPYSLLIDAHYDSNTKFTITENIPDLKDFEPYIAINPNFKDKELIDKLKELNIFSDTIKESVFEDKTYEIVKVNIELLKEYELFGDSILDSFKDKGDLVL